MNGFVCECGVVSCLEQFVLFSFTDDFELVAICFVVFRFSLNVGASFKRIIQVFCLICFSY